MSSEDEWDEEVDGDRDWENYDSDHSEDIKRAKYFRKKFSKYCNSIFQKISNWKLLKNRCQFISKL